MAQDVIYKKSVKGKFRNIKTLLMFITLGIYYLLPWVRWERPGDIPDQALLIDMPNRRAYFFFIDIWSHEVYYIAGILILAAILLFFVTSVWGRVWCGYACPQTIWTDLFSFVEKFFQGDRNERMRLDNSSWGFNKLWRKLATHLTWIFIGFLTGGAWVFYFNDAPTLLKELINFQASPIVLGWIFSLTFSTYIMAGFAREKVCTYMCPYARFQSAMFDQDTLLVSYDTKRGEPRSSHKKGESWDNRGHCIDCKQCVFVCPQGIDIREGLQMECIACSLCIDACDNIMAKMSLPKGLIRYDTERNLLKEKGSGKFHKLRFRTIYYIVLLISVSSIMFYSLATRPNLELRVLHSNSPLFVKLSNGNIRNGYTLKIFNKTFEDKVYKISLLEENQDTNLKVQNFSKSNITKDYLPVKASSIGNFKFFLSLKPQKENQKKVIFQVEDLKINDKDSYQSIFISR